MTSGTSTLPVSQSLELNLPLPQEAMETARDDSVCWTLMSVTRTHSEIKKKEKEMKTVTVAYRYRVFKICAAPKKLKSGILDERRTMCESGQVY